MGDSSSKGFATIANQEGGLRNILPGAVALSIRRKKRTAPRMGSWILTTSQESDSGSACSGSCSGDESGCTQQDTFPLRRKGRNI